MNPLNTSVSFSPDPGAAGSQEPFVHLKQEKIPETAESVDLNQLYRMWQRALDNLAAGLYSSKDCPVEFTGTEVSIWLDFYAYPSSKELAYELTTNIGEIEPPEIVSVPKDEDVIFTLSDSHLLEFYAENINLDWQIPCYIKDCHMVTTPSYNIEGSFIKLSREVFSVARVKASAFARKYRLNIVLEKGNNAINGLSPVITVAWRNSKGETETEQLDLKIPKCVEAALALCGGGGGFDHCDNADRDQRRLVYYSICDGSVLDVRSNDPESPCGKTVKA